MPPPGSPSRSSPIPQPASSTPAPPTGLIRRGAYGLPELGATYREQIRSSNRIANGGCHATGFLLAVRPLVLGGLIPADYPLSCFSLTGYSGGGKKMIAAYETNPPPALQSPRPYALGLTHKHLPEMRVHAGLTQPPIFCPAVGNFYKGLSVTLPLPLAQMPGQPSPAAIHAALAKAYAGREVRARAAAR